MDDVPAVIAEILEHFGKELTAELRQLLSTMSREESLVDFSAPWTYSDITFVVDGKKVYASKMILSMWSPVFEAMFHDNFREKDAKEISLPGKAFEAVIELMRVLHPPNKDISEENVELILPMLQEYQMEVLLKRSEEYLCSQASCVRNFLLAIKYDLKDLHEANMAYLRRAPVSRLKSQPHFDKLDQETLVELLMDKCEKFEVNMDALREVRMVLERKKPTTFPGMHLLCDDCTGAREQQVDCAGCMRSCCKKLTEILRSLER